MFAKILMFLIGFCVFVPVAVWAVPLPREIVSVSLMTDEYLVNLVPAQRILALSRDADNSELSNITQQAREVRGRARMNIEQLLKLSPDLVLAPDWADQDSVKFLQSQGIRVIVVPTPHTWAQVLALVSQLGQELGAETRARQWLAKLNNQVKQLKRVRHEVTLSKAQRPSFLEYDEWGSSMSKGTLWPDIIRLAGVLNAGESLQPGAWGYAPLSLERLLELNPDWLVLPSEEALKQFGELSWLKHLQADPLFSQLSAVKHNRLLFLPERWKTATSPYILQAALAIQHAAYPNFS
ncbi:MAG: ABC transporter substrate-binding protein [Spirochaetales bacterium]|nr:ABC transporter substrate-binding protein [Spirochaetales bacterium]